MFKLKKYFEAELEVYQLSDDNGTYAQFVPARGGILSGFWVGKVPMFYMDFNTLLQVKKNIRGGNPVLFPICGPLEGGCYITPDGREYKMNQHGLARNMPWRVLNSHCGADKAQITLQLTDSADSKLIFPFSFELVYFYTIEYNRISIKQTYHNRSDREMPFYAGFHPYFYSPGAKINNLSIPSTSCYNLKTAQKDTYTGDSVTLSGTETNLVFSDLSENLAWFDRTDGYRISVEYDRSFRYLVLWTLQDREFFCLEPWMGNNDDMNNGKARLIKPGDKFSAQISYQMVLAQ